MSWPWCLVGFKHSQAQPNCFSCESCPMSNSYAKFHLSCVHKLCIGFLWPVINLCYIFHFEASIHIFGCNYRKVPDKYKTSWLILCATGMLSQICSSLHSGQHCYVSVGKKLLLSANWSRKCQVCRLTLNCSFLVILLKYKVNECQSACCVYTLLV